MSWPCHHTANVPKRLDSHCNTVCLKLPCELVCGKPGGLAGLIISVRFQVGKSISGVFYGKERAAGGCGGVLCGLPTSSPPGSCEHSPFSVIINRGGRGRCRVCSFSL